MVTLESLTENLTDEQLREGFVEIVEWRKTGVLKIEGIVRKVYQQFIDSTNATFPLFAMENPFLFEIAKRYYENNSIKERKISKILLNQLDNPRLSEQVFVGKGDIVYANNGAEEFGFTVGKEYEIEGVSPHGFLIMKNDKGEVDEYTTEYFQQYQPFV